MRSIRSPTAGLDNPGPRIEPHATFACVPGEGLTETLERPLSGDGTQAHQRLPGAREAADPLEGRRDVRTVVDGLVDVGERGLAESRRAEDRLHGVLIGKRERLPRFRSWDRRSLTAERPFDRHGPFVVLVLLPDHHHQAPGGPKRHRDVGERRDGVIEEHRPEPTDGEVETVLRKAVHLRVALLEGNVADSLRPGEFAGPLDHRGGEVDSERAPSPGRPRGVPRRPAGSTADVKDPVVCPYVVRAAKDLVVQPEFGVVVDAGNSVFQRPIPHRARAWMARRARLLAVVRVHRTRSYDSRVRRLRPPLTSAHRREACGSLVSMGPAGSGRRRPADNFARWSLATRSFALRHSV